MEFYELAKLISEVINVPADKIRREQSLKKDLGADSLDSLELLMTLEQDYGVVIPDEELVTFVTVQDIVDYMEKQK